MASSPLWVMLHWCVLVLVRFCKCLSVTMWCALLVQTAKYGNQPYYKGAAAAAGPPSPQATSGSVAAQQPPVHAAMPQIAPAQHTNGGAPGPAPAYQSPYAHGRYVTYDAQTNSAGAALATPPPNANSSPMHPGATSYSSPYAPTAAPLGQPNFTVLNPGQTK